MKICNFWFWAVFQTLNVAFKGSNAQIPCFVKHANYILDGYARDSIGNLNLNECMTECVMAVTKRGYDCTSIMYFSTDPEYSCILNTENRFTQPNAFIENSDNSYPSDYYDHICNNDTTSSTISPSTEQTPSPCFEKHASYILDGYAKDSITTSSVSECMTECLTAASNRDYVCTSIMYFSTDPEFSCILNIENRFTKPDSFVAYNDDTYPSDYYDNICNNGITATTVQATTVASTSLSLSSPSTIAALPTSTTTQRTTMSSLTSTSTKINTTATTKKLITTTLTSKTTSTQSSSLFPTTSSSSTSLPLSTKCAKVQLIDFSLACTKISGFYWNGVCYTLTPEGSNNCNWTNNEQPGIVRDISVIEYAMGMLKSRASTSSDLIFFTETPLEGNDEYTMLNNTTSTKGNMVNVMIRGGPCMLVEWNGGTVYNMFDTSLCSNKSVPRICQIIPTFIQKGCNEALATTVCSNDSTDVAAIAEDCARKCLLTTWCSGFNYNQSTKSCIMLTENTATQSIVCSSGWIYYERQQN